MPFAHHYARRVCERLEREGFGDRLRRAYLRPSRLYRSHLSRGYNGQRLHSNAELHAQGSLQDRQHNTLLIEDMHFCDTTIHTAVCPVLE